MYNHTVCINIYIYIYIHTYIQIYIDYTDIMMSSKADRTACRTDSEVQQELQKSGMPSQVRDPRGIAWAFPTRLETTFPEF